jgi:predicted transcriptional regulator
VGEVMGEPLAVVAPGARLDRLMPHLENAGAVLVEGEGGLRILTRSDAVAALARLEQAT